MNKNNISGKWFDKDGFTYVVYEFQPGKWAMIISNKDGKHCSNSEYNSVEIVNQISGLSRTRFIMVEDYSVGSVGIQKHTVKIFKVYYKGEIEGTVAVNKTHNGNQSFYNVTVDNGNPIWTDMYINDQHYFGDGWQWKRVIKAVEAEIQKRWGTEII